MKFSKYTKTELETAKTFVMGVASQLQATLENLENVSLDSLMEILEDSQYDLTRAMNNLEDCYKRETER